jgi:hypothetical protein
MAMALICAGSRAGLTQANPVFEVELLTVAEVGRVRFKEADG